MSEQEDFFKVFEQVLSGKRVNTQVGRWKIYNSTTNAIDLWFENSAIYGFIVGSNDRIIKLSNYHKEADKGMGTPTLKYLESAFLSFAKKHKKIIILEFPAFNQPDTVIWLKKNNYILEHHDEMDFYTKTLK